MASIANDPRGRKRVLLICPDGKRRAVRLGRVSDADALTFRDRVDMLVEAAKNKSAWDKATLRWVGELPDRVHSQLARWHIVPPRELPEAIAAAVDTRIGTYVTAYIAGRKDVEPATWVNWGHTKRNLIEFFGKERMLASITAGDAADFRRYLITEQELSPATVGKRCKNARQFFEDAVDRDLINRNPFAKIKGHSGRNRDRLHFITRDIIDSIIANAPDTQWKLIIALSRYGGLRCPSETLALRWGDVLWDQQRILITCKKTRKQGKTQRIIPMFPELKGLLLQAFNEAEPGEEFVITKYRSACCNLRTQFQRIIERAGAKAWPRLFHNMRASRQTELQESWPGHVVTDWMGNTEEVAKAHYLTTTDDHYRRAAEGAAHFEAQYAPANPRKGPQPKKSNEMETFDLQDVASGRDDLREKQSGPGQIRTADLVLIRDAL